MPGTSSSSQTLSGQHSRPLSRTYGDNLSDREKIREWLWTAYTASWISFGSRVVGWRRWIRVVPVAGEAEWAIGILGWKWLISKSLFSFFLSLFLISEYLNLNPSPATAPSFGFSRSHYHITKQNGISFTIHNLSSALGHTHIATPHQIMCDSPFPNITVKAVSGEDRVSMNKLMMLNR